MNINLVEIAYEWSVKLINWTFWDFISSRIDSIGFLNNDIKNKYESSIKEVKNYDEMWINVYGDGNALTDDELKKVEIIQNEHTKDYNNYFEEFNEMSVLLEEDYTKFLKDKNNYIDEHNSEYNNEIDRYRKLCKDTYFEFFQSKINVKEVSNYCFEIKLKKWAPYETQIEELNVTKKSQEIYNSFVNLCLDVDRNLKMGVKTSQRNLLIKGDKYKNLVDDVINNDRSISRIIKNLMKSDFNNKFFLKKLQDSKVDCDSIKNIISNRKKVDELFDNILNLK